ncbi:hypothetical protein HZC30_03730 [Candidatus Woesearchaeota archaeon]|nr:hypothetical protein [Candidatus Woesearchaeota archaeon]
MVNDYNQKYVEFASNIHFYEFLLDEFKKPHFELEKYSPEISKLEVKTNWDVIALSNFLRTHPKSFDLFQEIFQLTRFTNTQLTHFLFDVALLNNANKNILKKYLIKNLEDDEYFYKKYISELKRNKIEVDSNNLINVINDNEVLFDSFIWIFKSVVSRYVSDSVAKVELLHNRLSKEAFKDVSERTAKYLMGNLKLNNILKGIDIKEFLLNKRMGIDTKSLHGKFGNIKIKNILEKHKLINVDDIFNELGIKKLPRKLTNPQLEKYANQIIYVTEKYLDGISKRKDNKLKKFDFIIIYNLKPKILIETNFYSTSGTKIGINQGEYVDLKQDIEKLSDNYIFLWITDGNYWLTCDGHSRLIHLYTYFGDQILNYNLFDKKLFELTEKLQ